MFYDDSISYIQLDHKRKINEQANGYMCMYFLTVVKCSYYIEYMQQIMVHSAYQISFCLSDLTSMKIR